MAYTLHRHSREPSGGNRTRKRGPAVQTFDAMFQAHEAARAIQATGWPAWIIKTHGFKAVWHYQMDGKVRRNGKRIEGLERGHS